MELRRALSSDLDELMQLSRDCFGEASWGPQIWNDLLALHLRDDGQQHLWIAQAFGAGPMLGYLATLWIGAPHPQEEARDGLEVEVQAIAVHPGMRRQGVGRELLRHEIAQWRALRVRQVFLEVREGNAAAQQFYRNHGFTFCGRRRNYYHTPAEDALLMRWEGGP